MTGDDPKSSTAHLPGLLGVLARAGHGGAALRLLAEWGGTSRYIPAHPGPDSPLVALIGVDAAQVLAAVAGGGNYDVPMATYRHARKGVIARAAGSTREVARRFGVTERWVRKVRQGSTDPRQGSLFDARPPPEPVPGEVAF